jgi:hypothetical protein
LAVLLVRILLVLLEFLLLACADSLKARLDPVHDPTYSRWRLRVGHPLLDHLEEVCAGSCIA